MSETEYDVCLMAEGTYPYISGGVSSVISQMVNGMPNLRFAIFFIGSTAAQAEKPVYAIPEHVKHIEKVFLFDGLGANQKVLHTDDSPARDAFFAALDAFFSEPDLAKLDECFTDLLNAYFSAGDALSFEDFREDGRAWDTMVEACRRLLPDVSFIDYFYTTRFMSLPIWLLLDGLRRVPRAKIYHSLCTGYAGLAAVAAAKHFGVKSIITEHGIYVKERIAEISLATWIHEARHDYVTVDSDLGALKQLWIAKFRYLAEYSYRQCDCLTTLYNGNRRMQEELGAPIGKSRIIPNGIDLQAFAPAYARRQERLKSTMPKVIGFVGRVVRIKDVKTLLRAMQDIHARMPEAVLKLFGPTNEEQDYYEECVELSQQLGIASVVDFAGKQNLREALADIDVMVLTSISEGQPLVVLEGFAAGIPCVSTDVGSCRALIFGDSPEDRALGSGGDLTKVASPRQTANALLRLLQNPEMLAQFGENGRERVKRYYQQTEILSIYQALYDEFMPQANLAGRGD